MLIYFRTYSHYQTIDGGNSVKKKKEKSYNSHSTGAKVF